MRGGVFKVGPTMVVHCNRFSGSLKQTQALSASGVQGMQTCACR